MVVFYWSVHNKNKVNWLNSRAWDSTDFNNIVAKNIHCSTYARKMRAIWRLYTRFTHTIIPRAKCHTHFDTQAKWDANCVYSDEGWNLLLFILYTKYKVSYFFRPSTWTVVFVLIWCFYMHSSFLDFVLWYICHFHKLLRTRRMMRYMYAWIRQRTCNYGVIMIKSSANLLYMLSVFIVNLFNMETVVFLSLLKQ